ncbi:MAG TPA: HAMP domain-containing sensor histidine kinase [Candidatus Nitrosotalea sp.]|nr:HAMP domain-containing sensor histidine kinase [Candidatus Nitrosotalea sp.]
MKLVKTNSSEKTEILFGQHDVLERWKQCAFNTKEEINIYADSGSSLETLGFKNYIEILRYLKEKNVRIRYITEISESNLQFCKLLMNIISEFRHLDGIKGAFGVTDEEFLATSTLQEVKPVSHAIYSNAEQLVEVQRHIFETLWNRSIPAERKLKEIEEGTVTEFFEVINDPRRSTEIITNLVETINNEALILLPLSKSMVRLHKLGILNHLAKPSTKGSKTNIICPIDSENEGIVKFLRACNSNISVLNGPEGSVGLFVVDNSKFFISEVHEETVKEFSKTLGFGLYSNSVAVIQSIRMFFELLWKSDELNEKLKDHERLQAEFINIASHEIKTPIQSILTYSELMQSEPEKNESYVDAIQRNALRLKLLANNLLDLTKIQSKTLTIRKDRFDLSDAISSIVEDFRNQIKSNQSHPAVNILFSKREPIFVEADKERITQVISNLVHNALKFTNEGSISLVLKKREGEIDVTVKDTGTGIERYIMPNLFTKFTTKHHSGTGVGLYISKNIVEAHGGKIWARNNHNGKGASFVFTIPIET